MSQACSDASDGGGANHRNAAVPRAANTLALAAAPTFVLMAVLSGVSSGGSAEMLCATAHASPLSGMVTMYLLMSALHAGPWLKLLSSARGRVRLLGKPVSLG